MLYFDVTDQGTLHLFYLVSLELVCSYVLLSLLYVLFNLVVANNMFTYFTKGSLSSVIKIFKY